MEGNKINTDYIFITEDPLGREVRLKSTTWNYHIVGGDHTREEFIGQEDMVKSVIQDPCFILPNNPDDQHDTRQKYIEPVVLDKLDQA